MLLWRPAPAGCTISASSPQQQQIWVVVPGDQVTTGGTVSSTKYLPRYQHHIGPSVPGSSLQPVSAASSAEYCKLFLRCVAGGGWRPAAALQHRTSPAPAQTESSPQLQSAVYSLPSLQLHRYTRLVASLHTVTNTPAPWWTSAPTRPPPSRRQRTR